MDIPDMQIIGGKFYTKPAAPVEIPRATVEEWLATAQAEKANAETSLSQAKDSKATTINQLDDTIQKWGDDATAADAQISTIQGWLDSSTT